MSIGRGMDGGIEGVDGGIEEVVYIYIYIYIYIYNGILISH